MITQFRRRSTDLLAEPGTRPGIRGVAYDTAWVASVPTRDRRGSRFPTALRWLADNQLPDGSWGSSVRYEHDRILCTLAALAPLAEFGQDADDRAAVERGARYLWQHGHLLAHEPIELVGFELLVPALVERARQAGVPVPPHLDIYAAQRARKLQLLPSEALYSPRATVVHSLEFLGREVDVQRLRTAQGANGGIGNSPAATAFFLTQADDARAQGYLQSSLDHTGGAMAPVLYPCETFELLWAAYHLFLAGIPSRRLLRPSERATLRASLVGGGVSLAPSFPIPDADDTAVALLLLHELGDGVDPSVLEAFRGSDGSFVSFPYERHSSVGVNTHVLHALLEVPGYPDASAAIDGVLEYLLDAHSGLYWIDKWHISPLYATSHALLVLDRLDERRRARVQHVIDRSREWLRHSQNADGSWGFYGQPTVEETAYALLALASPRQSNAQDARRCDAAVAYLLETEASAYPPMWIDKCLYTPPLIVRAAVQGALEQAARLQHSQPYESRSKKAA